MREIFTITLVAVAMMVAAMCAAHYFATQLGFTATEVEIETHIPDTVTY